MRNWRETGVVPDSDDDSDAYLTDSDVDLPRQNNVEAPVATTDPAPPPSARPEEADDTEIWDVLNASPVISKSTNKPDNSDIWDVPNPSPVPASSNPPKKPGHSDIWDAPDPSTAPTKSPEQPDHSDTWEAHNPSPAISKPPEKPDHSDIWDVPDSSPARPSPTRLPRGRSSPKLTASVFQATIPTKKSVASIQSPATNVGKGSGSPALLRAPSATPGVHTPTAQNESPNSTASSPLSSPPSIRSISPSSSRAASPESPAVSRPAQVTTLPTPRSESPVPEDETPRQTAMRLGRSLRPRKPIQQHPYLLESAQYSTFMKSHGVKPVRVILEQEASRKKVQEEDDSQEQDFEPPESQDDFLHNTEESNLPLIGDDEIERDMLAPSPSPPGTSPRGVAGLRTSSQPTDETQTPHTIISDDDDDLPTLDRLRQDLMNLRVRSLKRKSSELIPARRKRHAKAPSSSQDSSPLRPRFVPPPDIFELSSSPPGSQGQEDPPSEILGAPSPTQGRPKSPFFAPSPSLPWSPRRKRLGTQKAPIPVDEDQEGQSSDSDSSTSSKGSGSDSEVVRKHSKRIRGVLPASWLRLDPGTNKVVGRRERKSPEPEPVVVSKRGVALPKQRTPGRLAGTQFLFDFDESDEESQQRQQQSGRESQPGAVKPASTARIMEIFDDGKDPSDMEDDAIDLMISGRKRGGSPSTSRAKRQKTSFSDRHRKPRQTRITEAFGRSKTTSAIPKTSTAKQSRTRQDRLLTKPASRKRVATPPLLSIVDVMEPQAPKFVKIAARVVKTKKSLGRTSPSRKLISLAARADNIDALSSLHNWKTSRTRQRTDISSAVGQEPSGSRAALAEMSSNSPRYSPSASRLAHTFPRKLVKQGSLGRFVTASVSQPTNQLPSTHSAAKAPRWKVLSRPAFQPAMLETEDIRFGPRQLKAHDRRLDQFFRSCNISPPQRSLLEYAESPDFLTSQATEVQLDTAAQGPRQKERARKDRTGRANVESRFRKKRVPRHVDVEAPQFARAGDPLPFEPPAAVELEIQEPQMQDKLNGLGPYGSQYTRHFDIFPLDPGAFFHETTLIGRGFVSKAVDQEKLLENIRLQRGSVTFMLDGRSLRWGIWNDSTSSELGILLDCVTEQVCTEMPSAEIPDNRAVEAAEFVLRYMLDHLCVEDLDTERSLVSRFIEVILGFLGRVEHLEWSEGSARLREAQVEVCSRLSITAMAVYTISRSSSNTAQHTKAEDTLRRMVSATVKGLLSFGTEELRALYGDMQRRSFLERGIRSDRWLASSWVICMRILESANIPRASFWDITCSLMCPPSIASGNDAQVFERLWQDMFTLLPLGEMDSNGVLINGLRKVVPLEGWTLPQRLLKRVFQLYKSKSRQSPSFNEYCRALVGRCHYLVHQWGWYKSTGIIGTIFDFFGSENLANLRNEEVHRSPQFIEELGGKASLAVEPDDRCFHIFLKILALTIQRMRRLDHDKDIKNLIARTLPNHNRQHLKEDVVHQRDLAALRNHHDLLCTLFWAAPPELRPGLHLIEKLVAPGSAHKEACLINVYAWNRLARFVISTDESVEAFRPFIIWSNTIFNQVLDQYLSAASDIEQQFRELSSEKRQASTAVRDEMIARNKATAMAVLHTLLKASLDVLKHAPSFEAATGALNITQLQKVFTTLDLKAPDFDWGVLQVALDTFETFFARLDQASEHQYSTGETGQIDPQVIDDAVLFLNEKLAKDFFWMARVVMGLPPKMSPNKQTRQAACLEKSVTLAGRIAARFAKDRLTKLSAFFSPGKYNLFPDMPANLASMERKLLPLFIATLVKNEIFDFKDLMVGKIGLWLLCITKPEKYYSYEYYLGDMMKKRPSFDFMERATVVVGVAPDYNSNVELFSCAMHHMREKLRDADGQSRQQLRQEFSRSLDMVMHRMKEDLFQIRPEPAAHAAYVDFVRQIISLIKSHGVNICKINPFFTQAGADYSPPAQDPHLHMAGIVAYGVRVGEEERSAVPQFFHYLWNNFKIALGNGRMEQERNILAEAMGREPHVLSYVLQYMLPAALIAFERESISWMLLEAYVGAVEHVLTGKCLPRELKGQDIEHTTGLLVGVLGWYKSLRGSGGSRVSLRQVYAMKLVGTLIDALQPSLRVYLYSARGDDAAATTRAVQAMRDLLVEARSYIESILPKEEAQADTSNSEVAMDQQPTALPNIGIHTLLAGLPLEDGQLNSGRDPKVQEFATVVVTDVRKTWTVTNERVMVQMAAGRMATSLNAQQQQQGQGTLYGQWDWKKLLREWWALAGRWELGVRRGEEGVEVGGRIRRRWGGRGGRMRKGAELGELIF